MSETVRSADIIVTCTGKSLSSFSYAACITILSTFVLSGTLVTVLHTKLNLTILQVFVFTNVIENIGKPKVVAEI